MSVISHGLILFLIFISLWCCISITTVWIAPRDNVASGVSTQIIRNLLFAVGLWACRPRLTIGSIWQCCGYALIFLAPKITLPFKVLMMFIFHDYQIYTAIFNLIHNTYIIHFYKWRRAKQSSVPLSPNFWYFSLYWYIGIIR